MLFQANVIPILGVMLSFGESVNRIYFVKNINILFVSAFNTLVTSSLFNDDSDSVNYIFHGRASLATYLI